MSRVSNLIRTVIETEDGRECKRYIRKIRYVNRKKADEVLEKMKFQKVPDADKLVIIDCRHCYGFHIGNEKEWTKP
jgi:hypothetical protein